MKNDLFSLKNKTAIVTGAHGWLGKGIIKGLTDFGAQVIAIGRQECDVTNDDSFRKYTSKYKKIDILINNAMRKANESFETMTKDEWSQGIEGTLTHYFTCSQAVIPKMKQTGGSIINIASLYAFLGVDQSMYLDLGNNPAVHYTAAKHGVIGLTRYIATYFGDNGIRCNALSPGYFPKKTPGVPERPDYIEEMIKRTPMRRIGKPDDLTGAVVFLASDASSFITGQNIIVDGGFSSW
jgi:NAD(P)-dependent dehydrogenase (short-subunit alcohol dehydrogenase family)